MLKKLLLPAGLFLLLAFEILRVYFIMPFPGSQQSDSIRIAYFLNNNIFLLRIIALVIVLPPFVHVIRKGRLWQKSLLIFLALFYVLIFYLFNFRFQADKMFYQPKVKSFAGSARDTTNKDKLVIGIVVNEEARAYPIEIIGYHHQVKDTVGGHPVLVTYCTVCRTGRIYSPFVNGRYEQFRLVGMDHFNAMFEDASTKSWWQQATGTAIAGKLKGVKLQEIASAQMRLGDWMFLHPNSLTLQQDPIFIAKYDSLKGYDEGVIEGSLEKRDSGSWKFKSWVIGVNLFGQSRAYDWNRLMKNRLISDTLGDAHLLLTMEPNNKTFYVLAAIDSLHFQYDSTTHLMKEEKTKTSWRLNGECLNGSLKGERLTAVQSYQEFWHSWRSFYPHTSTYP
jgi:hypothetical protein